MHSAKIQRTRILVQQGDIAMALVDVIVSPDTTDIWMQKGTASAIAHACKVPIREEIDVPRPIPIGEVVMTSGGNLPARNIFHVPIMHPDDEETDRSKVIIALNGILRKMEDMKLSSIAFPAFGSATARFPYDVCAKVMLGNVFDYLFNRTSHIEVVAFVLYNLRAYEEFVKTFNSLKQVYMC
ncbi:MAG: macro domain-containing protein [bacterium]